MICVLAFLDWVVKLGKGVSESRKVRMKHIIQSLLDKKSGPLI